MRLLPKVLTGQLNPANKGAFEWGWNNLLAHACQTFVVIIDPDSVQVLQVLGGHKALVSKVRWAPENHYHDISNAYNARLATADTGGNIIVWDVAQAVPKVEFTDNNKSVCDMLWVHADDASSDLLLALHHPYILNLWNADTGTKLWRKTYTDTLVSFSINPFDSSCVAFLGQECIVFIDDFSTNKVPSSNGKKFYISSPSGVPSSHSSGSLADKKGSLNLARRMGRILVGDVKPNVEEATSNECLQLSYHPAVRHHLILLYSRDVLILDLDINQTVGIIPMERSGSPFVQVWPCRQRDALICLHENGCVSLRVRRKMDVAVVTPASEGTGAFDDTLLTQTQDVLYDLRCQTDPMRVTKLSKVLAMAVNPMSEKSVALVISDSRVLIWTIRAVTSQNIEANMDLLPVSISDQSGIPDKSHKIPYKTNAVYPKQTLNDIIGPIQSDINLLANHKYSNLSLKFVLIGLWNGINGQITVICMCPPVTTKNWSVYEPLLAVGLHTGVIQIYNLTTFQCHREYSVHVSPVRGIEWLNLTTFASFAYPTATSQSSLVKNELVIVDTTTGHVKQIRTNKDNEPPIEFIRVSGFKQYFVIVVKDRPCELWDANRHILLREMAKHVSRISALGWAPASYSMKNIRKRHNKQDSTTTPTETVSTVSLLDSTGESKSHMNSLNREHFIFTDHDGTVFHLVVEGSVVIDSSKIAPEPGMSTITGIIWKTDYVIFSDTEGHFNQWDLRTKKSKYLQSNRGYVKNIRFAPGRGNHKFLAHFNSGVDIWDADSMQYIERLRHPRDIPRIIDVAWAGSEQPVIATEDGCIRLMDIKLSRNMSPVNSHSFIEGIFCPYLETARISLTIKYLLQHQPFYDKYELRLRDMPESETNFTTVINQQLEVIPKNIYNYLTNCRFGTADRCLIAARLLGDEAEIDLWTIALHYLIQDRFCDISNKDNKDGNVESSKLVSPIKTSSPEIQTEPPEVDIQHKNTGHVLDHCYDILTDKDSFLKYQLERVALHDGKRTTYEHTNKCFEKCVMLGQTDRAVQLLLETEPENESYYVDSIRACLVASVTSSGASQSTVKLVATNLIANGKLSEGVQLLCLIGKTLDACRYLQTYKQWHQAAWLAKAMLSTPDCAEVMKRWVDHLCSNTVLQKNKAILVMISLRQYVTVIEMLYTMRHFDRAVCFIEACLEFGVLEKTIENTPLIDAVYLEYARYMTTLGNRQAARYYCNLAGDRAGDYLREIEIVLGDNGKKTND